MILARARNGGRSLTEDDVKRVTKRANLRDVCHLNAWGMQLSDISVVTLLPNVEVLSLSANQIASLESFQYAVNLRELYLRKNDITDLAQLIYLVALPELRVLWLDDNLIQELPNYRLAVLAFLPHLQLLDNIDVQADEVALAERLLQDGDPTITLAMQRAKQLLSTPPAQPTAEAADERGGREKKGMQEAWPNAQPVPGAALNNDPAGPGANKKATDRSNLSAVLLLLEGLDAASLGIIMTKCHKLIAAQEGEE